jgi:hypothetical protein
MNSAILYLGMHIRIHITFSSSDCIADYWDSGPYSVASSMFIFKIFQGEVEEWLWLEF